MVHVHGALVVNKWFTYSLFGQNLINLASRISCPESKFALAPPLDELDGPDEELQRRAEGVANQLLALTVATCLDVAGVFRQLSMD